MDNLLNNLVGRWSLTGTMGDSRLYQTVDARWMLRELFVEMRFSPVRIGEDGNPDYEALYLIGHDRKTDKYVLHLFDTYGVSSKPIPGIGTRKDDSIKFRFDYEIGPWYNVFTWQPKHKSWKNIITHNDDKGKTIIFADKELVPVQQFLLK